MNKLYYGDNFDILRTHIPDESVDLIYIDPPFNSKRDYNIIYDGAIAQAEAFSDTWSLTNIQDEKMLIYEQDAQRYSSLHTVIDSLEKLLIGSNPSLFGYLLNMAIRLVELHRVLKNTGSLYLHCDPTVSHYVKILLDSIFGRDNFRNEIVWCYTAPTNTRVNFPKKHDVILRYTKSDKWFFDYQSILIPYSEETIARTGRGSGEKGLYKDDEPESKHKNRLHKGGKIPEDWWIIPRIQGNSTERLGFPTQKPLTLLERIIEVSCPEGGIILDAFCGCGTSAAAAKKLGREFIGIDITYLSIDLIKKRLIDTFYKNEKAFYEDVEVFGIPKDLEGARILATQTKSDRVRKEFEKWAVFKAGGVYTEKKGADTGFDGYFFLWDAGETKIKGIVQVKSGHIGVHHIRDFSHTIDRESAKLGFFITLEEPTKHMYYEIDMLPKVESKQGRKYNKIYIITVQELLDDKLPSLPFGRFTKKAERYREIKDDRIDMDL